MQEYQIETEEAALELIENLTEQDRAEIEERIMYALKTFIEELLEEELSQRLKAVADPVSWTQTWLKSSRRL